PRPCQGTLPPAAEPSSVTLGQGLTFLICDHAGEIDGRGPDGLFVGVRRMCNRLLLRVDGAKVQPLASAVDEPFHARFVGRIGVEGDERAPILVLRDLWVGRGMRADITLRHEAAEERRVTVSVLVGSDLA